MGHFPNELWADFVRGSVSEEYRARVVGHLDSACAECRASRDIWTAVVRLASREADYEPPAASIRDAVDLFSEHTPVLPSLADRPTRVAELLFDSFQNPLPAGVRSLEQTTRHLTYQAGSVYVDVRIEELASAGVASVVGQLMRHPGSSQMPLEGLSVVLTSGRSTVAETTTNRFGEFAFEMDTQRDNNLAIGVGDEFAVVVPLSERRGRA